MLDFKKEQKDLYQPKASPAIVDVPEMLFLAVDGKGDPNTSPEYAAAVETLYGLSYGIKMGNKAVLEYVIPPLEGFWTAGDDFRGGGAAILDKSQLCWTMLLRQPDFVTQPLLEGVKAALAQKKPGLNIGQARLLRITEGLCVQTLHIGSYDDEPATIAAMDQFALDKGYRLDMAGERRHHEIYLSDPRRTVPEKLKTVLRHPIQEGGK